MNTTSDSTAPSNTLSLRQAIEVVNGTIAISSLTPAEQAQISGPLSSPNTIAFDIPGQGVHTIAPTSALPGIATPVVINGYTQPGSSPNTLTLGDNAKLMIELDGEHSRYRIRAVCS